MHTRFEDDLAEIADDGNVLVICAGRKKVFLEGPAVEQHLLADVAGVEAGDGGVVVRMTDGSARSCPLPSGAEDELCALATRLDDCVRAWR